MLIQRWSNFKCVTGCTYQHVYADAALRTCSVYSTNTIRRSSHLIIFLWTYLKISNGDVIIFSCQKLIFYIFSALQNQKAVTFQVNSYFFSALHGTIFHDYVLTFICKMTSLKFKLFSVFSWVQQMMTYNSSTKKIYRKPRNMYGNSTLSCWLTSQIKTKKRMIRKWSRYISWKINFL